MMTDSPDSECIDFVKTVLRIAGCISGKIRLVNIFCHASHQVSEKMAKDLQWFPYVYGPYSTKLASIINTLIGNKEIVTEKKRGVLTFCLASNIETTKYDDVTENMIRRIVNMTKREIESVIESDYLYLNSRRVH